MARTAKPKRKAAPKKAKKAIPASGHTPGRTALDAYPLPERPPVPPAILVIPPEVVDLHGVDWVVNFIREFFGVERKR